MISGKSARPFISSAHKCNLGEGGVESPATLADGLGRIDLVAEGLASDSQQPT
jgi:hypothetical protein